MFLPAPLALFGIYIYIYIYIYIIGLHTRWYVYLHIYQHFGVKIRQKADGLPADSTYGVHIHNLQTQQ